MFVCCHYPPKLPFRMKKDTSSNKHNGCFIIIMNGIVRYMYIVRMLAHCGCYNEIVVPNCKKREAGENLLFHLEFESGCKTYSHTSLPQLKYICKLNTAQVSFVKRFSSLGNLILEVSFIFHKVIYVRYTNTQNLIEKSGLLANVFLLYSLNHINN